MTTHEILRKLPYGKEFLFVDELLQIDENIVKGTFTFKKDLFFYNGHFKESPITPAVILTETMAQIGLVCLGIYILNNSLKQDETTFGMTSNKLDFLKPVYPGEQVWVTGEKNYFRFKKLSCNVIMENAKGEIVSRGTISGMIISKSDER